MDKELIGLLIALVAVTGGLGLPFFVIYFQNKERRALIEKGMDPNLVFPWRRPGSKSPASSPAGPLVWGVLLTGIGLGILIGLGVSIYFFGQNTPVIVNGTAVLFGGLALIVYYSFWKKEQRNKAE